MSLKGAFIIFLVLSGTWSCNRCSSSFCRVLELSCSRSRRSSKLWLSALLRLCIFIINLGILGSKGWFCRLMYCISISIQALGILITFAGWLGLYRTLFVTRGSLLFDRNRILIGSDTRSESFLLFIRISCFRNSRLQSTSFILLYATSLSALSTQISCALWWFYWWGLAWFCNSTNWLFVFCWKHWHVGLTASSKSL